MASCAQYSMHSHAQTPGLAYIKPLAWHLICPIYSPTLFPHQGLNKIAAVANNANSGSTSTETQTVIKEQVRVATTKKGR